LAPYSAENQRRFEAKFAKLDWTTQDCFRETLPPRKGPNQNHRPPEPQSTPDMAKVTTMPSQVIPIIVKASLIVFL